MRHRRTIGLVVALVWCVGARAAGAATFTVDSTADIADQTPADALCKTPAGACTLRAAVQQANALADTDTILVPNGHYALGLTGAGEDLAATGDLDIAGSVIITALSSSGVSIDGQAIDRVFHITSPGAVVTMEGLVIFGGTADSGGGIRNTGTLTLKSCSIQSNVATIYGGGIDNAGALTILDSWIQSNSCAEYGGGLANGPGGSVTVRRTTVSGNYADLGGGGVYNNAIGPGLAVEITDCLIASNVASATGAGGGGIANLGNLTLLNTTISGNQASGSLIGGGGLLAAYSTSVNTLNNVTVAENDSGSSSGGGIRTILGAPPPTVSNTIVANNLGTFGPDCAGAVSSAGFNLIANLSGCSVGGDPTGNILGGAANLGPLAFNGGPTDTHTLLAGSQAIDAGNDLLTVGTGGSACAATDQRLGPRPLDGDGDIAARCDIGAVEIGCGNNFLESGEFCDEPCCAASCTSYKTPGSPCEDGDLCTTEEFCDGSLNCTLGTPVTCGGCETCDSTTGCVVAPPAPGCRAPLGAKKSFFSFKPGKTPEKNVVVWKWGRGPETLGSEFGSGPNGPRYDLCVYDSDDTLVLGARIPSGSETLMCGIFPCWKTLANGNLKYANKAAMPEGVAALTLAPGVDGKTKFSLKAKGTDLAFPTLPLADPNLRVQLKQEGSPICWDATFSATVLKNRPDGYTAQSD